VRAPAAPEQYLSNPKFWNYEISPAAAIEQIEKAIAHVSRQRPLHIVSETHGTREEL
jgi:hypothetical protein